MLFFSPQLKIITLSLKKFSCISPQSLASHRLRMWHDFFNQSQSTVKQSQSTPGLLSALSWKNLSKDHNHSATDLSICRTAGSRARSSAVSPEQSVMVLSKSFTRNRISTHSLWPAAELRWRAVLPFLSCLFITAPLSNKNCTVCAYYPPWQPDVKESFLIFQ